MKRDFSRLSGREFDLLIVGGGIYGAWVAYDAALRGLRVAIVEQNDWASGTSCGSSKLIHGGLRYLETYDFKLVRKALKERQRLLTMAPHRVWPLRFGVPVYEDSRVSRLQLKAGLTLYDLLAGLPGALMTHRYFSRRAFSERFPFLRDTTLRGGFTYADAQTDDARLVLELIAGAIEAGAVCVNHCRVTGWREDSGRVCGATVEDVVGHDCVEIAARQVVNTTGLWMASEPPGNEWCRLSKGIHLVMPELPGDEALLLTAKSDGRVFFVIPWYGRTLLGTTDIDYRGAPDKVKPEPEEVVYLLDAANHYLKTKWTESDVVGRYAGVRVMKRSDAADPSSVSRDWELKTAVNGVHYSIGGKLTSAREDASMIVDRVCSELGINAKCATLNHVLPWAPHRFDEWQSAIHDRAERLGINSDSVKWLIRRHGTRIDEVFHIVDQLPSMAERIVPALPFIYADLLLCARDEMAVHVVDLLRRRMPLLILAKLGEAELNKIVMVIANAAGWREDDVRREVAICLQIEGR